MREKARFRFKPITKKNNKFLTASWARQHPEQERLSLHQESISTLERAEGVFHLYQGAAE
jgi:hypothetical protein